MDLTPGKLYVCTSGDMEEIIALSVDGRWQIEVYRREFQGITSTTAQQKHKPAHPRKGDIREALDTDLTRYFEDWSSNSAPRYYFEDHLLPEEWERVNKLWFAEIDRRVDLELRLPRKYVPSDYVRNRDDLARHPDAWKVLARCLLCINLDFGGLGRGGFKDKQSPAELSLINGRMRLIMDMDDHESAVFASSPGTDLRYPDSIGKIIESAPEPFRYTLGLIRQALPLLARAERGGTGSSVTDMALEANTKTVLSIALAQLNADALDKITLVERTA